MKIDTNTINVLKNFAKINPSIVVQEGNLLKTISPTKTIMAKAEVKNKFPTRFAIYNLDQFIALHSTFTDPDVEFGDNSLTLIEGNRSSHFIYADENTVMKELGYDLGLSLPSVDVKFKMTDKDLRDVEKAAGILGLPELAVVGDGTTVSLVAINSKKSTLNDFSIEIGETNKTFKAIFRIDNIKIIPGDYEVSISSKGISHFVGDGVEYFIAVEQNSTF